jgi:hypothetical protein
VRRVGWFRDRECYALGLAAGAVIYGIKRGRPEQRKIDQRICQHALSAPEHDTDGAAENHCRHSEQHLLPLCGR